jgi:hypothetical protein
VPAEECDPGNTDNCSATCMIRTPVCGDGFFTTVGPQPEACDGAKVPPGTPAGLACNSTCTSLVSPESLCGNGIVDNGEECDDSVPPFPDPPSSPVCSNTCKKISTPACVDCENAGDCFESVNNCTGVAAPFSTADQNKCFDVMRCIEQSNCFDGTGTLGNCYCGSLGLGACGAAPFTGPGSPDGACVAEIRPASRCSPRTSRCSAASARPTSHLALLCRASAAKRAPTSQRASRCAVSRLAGPRFPDRTEHRTPNTEHRTPNTEHRIIGDLSFIRYLAKSLECYTGSRTSVSLPGF